MAVFLQFSWNPLYKHHAFLMKGMLCRHLCAHLLVADLVLAQVGFYQPARETQLNQNICYISIVKVRPSRFTPADKGSRFFSLAEQNVEGSWELGSELNCELAARNTNYFEEQFDFDSGKASSLDLHSKQRPGPMCSLARDSDCVHCFLCRLYFGL